MRTFVEKLKTGTQLGPGEIREAFESLLGEDTEEDQIREFLLQLTHVPIDVDWLVEAATVLREHCVTVDLGTLEALDTSGTGGDQSGSFNFSTASALLVAACGVPVAKHGNRSISSKSGSADLLEALGIPIDLGPEEVARSVKENNFGFMMAPRYHPATARVQKIRRELKVVTVFNFLGPLVNPASVRRQVLGVFDPQLRPILAQALQRLGTTKSWVVWGEGGMDEMTLAGKTLVSEVTPAGIREMEIEPGDAVMRKVEAKFLRGGDGRKNAKLLRGIFSQSFFGPLLDCTLLNAGGALVVADQAEDLRQGVRQARLALEEGKAHELLARLAGATS
jgi:anthranilate phosphoribosyltransferase